MEVVFDHDLEDEYEDETYQPRGFIDLRSREAQQFNDLITLHLPPEVRKWDCLQDTGWVFEFHDCVLEVTNMGDEPLQVRVSTTTIPRTFIDPLRQILRSLISDLLPQCYCATDLAIVLLRLLEEGAAMLQEWQDYRDARRQEAGWDVNITTALDTLYTNPLGADLSTIDTSGNDILGQSIESICEMIPNPYRILHVEPVFRDDLLMRFERRRRSMANELSKLSYPALQECVSYNQLPFGSDKADLVRELCTPKVTFHGTQRSIVSSIVRYGFLKPGEKIGSGDDAQELEIRCGASYGIGIYSTPDPEYALHYAYGKWSLGEQTRAEDLPGLRLIVCAVLMGRALMVTRQVTRRTRDLADTTANSHVSPNKLEYVVFDKAQIIPCYVVHLDLGTETVKMILARTPKNPNQWVRKASAHPKLDKKFLWPAEVEALKAAKKAAAAKWFPYGFGPATGTSFVIEEIGEVSDDEENYGEYQKERKEVGNEIKEWEERMEQKGASWFDEYQNVRWTERTGSI
ncbi:hypothetical protein D0Z07_7893 [Hyphodiscus hymeniophilus]|uniref:PARP catalytic domain-containing protein n=1 Tax=Hyphodiscus hymeniophilus TaxID=353542 RepID=A0A9P6SLL3_9HELO|nr:hypothetical protein D0Z07_7893 [Hyphodiscus hymeniophilus]